MGAEAYAKCSHMNCYLENTPPGNCKYVVPTIKQKQLANDVPEQECTPEPSKEVIVEPPPTEPTATPTATPTAPTNTPTRNVVAKEEALRDCNAVSAGDASARVFFWHYGTVQPVFEYSN